MYLLGFDIGSSSVKASLVDALTRKTVASSFSPKTEMKITARKPGWAEQDPEMWWENLKAANKDVLNKSGICAKDIVAIGISYQMHGLVLVDDKHDVIRPAIIWCDSRAVDNGETARRKLGDTFCLNHLLNFPGNFTAAKLLWVKENEPEAYERALYAVLPGDYIAMRLTGRISTTVSGLSEGTFWDFKRQRLSTELLDCLGIDKKIIPPVYPTFCNVATLDPAAAKKLGLSEETKVCYRAGDQPNNAMSLGVLNPGEAATTAGTSGVVYGVLDRPAYDRDSRVNTFAHVNYTEDNTRIGALLCINGTGSLNSWIRNQILLKKMSYEKMNEEASKSPVGANGLSVVPFGNGVERMLCNKETGGSINNINFNIHSIRDVIRASQEGIAFSFCYGMDIMKSMGMDVSLIRACNSNMFLSALFRQTLANVSGATIELFDTDSAAGAAKGAGFGAGIYASLNEAFDGLTKITSIEPETNLKDEYEDAYNRWKEKF
ncbi:MAG: carbohydrate kinase [Dysgonamonadaceae bacterium]|jgi:xylulokinase|nr:carbohydrate kinase [Dysgonamonadaceae bacterium]